MSLSKPTRRETVGLKTFLSWDVSSDFSYIVDDNNKIEKLMCNICSKYRLSAIRQEAKLRNISGQGFQGLISYVDGVEYIHKSNVYRHVKSGSLHDWAKQKFTSTSQENNEVKKIPTLVTLISKTSNQNYRRHMTTALAIVIRERPMTDFNELIELQKKNGVQFVSGKQNNHACREFISFIAQAMREDLKHILAKANFLACEQDGTEARKSREEKELVFVKVVIRGRPVELLLKCQKMSKFGGVDARAIKEAIDDAFNTFHVSDDSYTKRLVCACADGAATNLGRLNGALTCLKNEDRPWLLIIHCSAHRLELAVKDAFQKMSDFARIDDMALNLYILFRNSGKCWRILVLLAENLGVILQRFPKASGTRFQVHKYNAIKCLTVNYLPLCLFAENMIEANSKICPGEQKAKLRGYFNQWQTYQYLACLQLYRVTLRETAHLSYCCQDPNQLVTDVIATLNSASDVLRTNTGESPDLPFPAEENTETGNVTITAEATNLPTNQRFKDVHQLTEKQQAQAKKAVTKITETYTLKRVREGKTAVDNIRSKLIPDIAQQIEHRMKSFQDDLFTSYRIGDHTQWDYSNPNYGTDEIRKISSHFKPCLDYQNFSLDMALKEWKCLKRLVHSKFSHLSNKVHFWVQIFSHHHQEFPHVLMVIELILITPYSSATVERGFSLMGRLLSNSRLSLTNSTLDDWMLIKINLTVLQTCDSSYEQKLIDKAVAMYLDAKPRREMRNTNTPTLSNSASANSIDTYLPIPADAVIPVNPLTHNENFLSLLSDDSCSSDVCVDSDSDVETE